jgi:translocator protein
MKPINIVKLLGLIGFCELVGVFGSLFMGNSVSTWYSLLNKPSWTPPNWVFAPIWITLYALMGASLFLLWTSKVGWRSWRKEKMYVIFLFAIQLTLNAAWSLVFFGQHQIFYGFVVIFALWFSILMLTLYSFPISKKAALLLAPYLVWVSIASFLNLSVLFLNSA